MTANVRFLSTDRPAPARPLVLGHRGASADCPENTLLAFRTALAQGADGVELDVMRCASGEVVVVHDDELARVAQHVPGSERPVRSQTLTELRRFDIGRGERVPTLDEVFAALGPRALVNVELKSPTVRTLAEHAALSRDDGLAAAVMASLARAGRLTADGPGAGATLVSSFDPFQLARFKRHAGRSGGQAVPLAFLFEREQPRPLREAWPARLLRVQAVHPGAELVDAAALRGWRRAGYAVHVWTVDDPREVAALATLGVDGIITNRPGAVRAQLEAAAG